MKKNLKNKMMHLALHLQENPGEVTAPQRGCRACFLVFINNSN